MQLFSICLLVKDGSLQSTLMYHALLHLHLLLQGENNDTHDCAIGLSCYICSYRSKLLYITIIAISETTLIQPTNQI